MKLDPTGEDRPKPQKPAKKRARRAAAKRGKGTGSKGKGKPGRPTKRTPLTILCEPDDMPSDDSVRNWMDSDPAFSRAIARAREAGFDRIALEALEIADNVGNEHKDTIETKFGEIPNKEWVMRSKLRVETRLKLLGQVGSEALRRPDQAGGFRASSRWCAGCRAPACPLPTS